MSNQNVMEYKPDENEQVVLDVIREERRVNPMRLRKATDLRKQYVNDALGQLQKAGVVQKVNRGLYEHVPENDDEYDSEREQLRTVVRDLRAAYEDVDGDGVGDALSRLEALLGVDDE